MVLCIFFCGTDGCGEIEVAVLGDQLRQSLNVERGERGGCRPRFPCFKDFIRQLKSPIPFPNIFHSS